MTIINHGPDDHEPSMVIIELVRDASRDLSAFVGKGPNYRLAGKAALTNLNAAIRLLEQTRDKLAAELTEPPEPPPDSPDATVTVLDKLLRERYGINGGNGGY